MLNLGIIISFCGFSLGGVILARGMSQGYFRRFPVFYSYMIYVLSGTAVMYGIYAFDKQHYASADWFYLLISILVEFSVLVEVSDHLFQPLPAIRRLGRALTLLISIGFAVFYLLPAIINSPDRQMALLDFALRASVTKLVIILALLFASRHFRLDLGKNVAGLMLGFSIYLGVNVANYAAAKAFDAAINARIFWIMTPSAYTLCLLVWMIALWQYAPSGYSTAVPQGNSPDVALELTRFNNQLSKFLER